MRNKLFLSFVAVVLLALISGLIYEHLITKDFEEYVRGTSEDRLYWVMASVEGSYVEGKWDHAMLHEALHWGIMLGFDIKIEDSENREIMSSGSALSMLSPAMVKRMQAISDLTSANGEYEQYPLYQQGTEIGTMHVRRLARPGIEQKEAIFKERGMHFLVMSFAIAGGGAVILSFFFSIFFSRPVRKLKDAVEKLAENDFSVRVPVSSGDELGQLSRSFNYMADALEREEALRRHLTSNIAHELRTPLAVMKATIEAMKDGVITDCKQGIENIGTETENLIRLVKGIEDVTQAEASFFSKKNILKFDLKELILRLCDRMQPLSREKGLDIRVTDKDSVMVSSTPDKLETVLQNIISNAIKFTEKGYVSIDFGLENRGFFVSVTDTGKGISEEAIGDIFKRFYRGEDSNGIGLGLSIVKELVDALSGRIDVKSSPETGTTFRIWLPDIETK